MKKVFMTLAAVLMGVTAMNAQLVIGGSFDLEGSAPKVTKDSEKGIVDKTNGRFYFGIAPKIGYMLMDQKLEVGASLSLGYNKYNYFKAILQRNDEGKLVDGQAFKDYNYSNFSFFINPYARYRVLNAKGFGIWFEGVVQLGTSVALDYKYFAYDEGYNQYGNIIYAREQKEADRLNQQQKDEKTSNFTGGISIRPVLTYDINEHWRIETGLNFLSIGVSGQVNKTKTYANGYDDKDGYVTKKNNTCDYIIGFWSGSVMSVGSLTIGAVYKF